MADISQIAKRSGIDAERTATELFGIAVEQYGANPLNEYLRSITGQNTPDTYGQSDDTFYATSYAASLANSQFRPKLKFLFRVEFLFKADVLEKFGRADWQRNFSFLIKSVDRPKVEFDYEAVNMYNFRTKVLKAITHRDLTMTFIDDVGNNVYEFFRFMMMVHSPITRRSIYTSQNITDVHTAFNTGSGMEFSDGLGETNDFAHRGVINTDVGSAIDAIKVTQFFINPNERIENATKQVSFFFINPRVISFDLDDVNHEANEANLFTMQFDYDYMVMSRQEGMEQLPPEKQVPPVGSAPGEPQPLGRAGDSPGGNDPYTSILAGVASRAVRTLASQTIGKAIRQVPGLGSVASTIGDVVSDITSRGIIGASQAVKQSTARSSRAVVNDNTTAGADSAKYTTSRGNFGPEQPRAEND